jgi:hypothetical protein
VIVRDNSGWIEDILSTVRACILTRRYRITNHAQERQEQYKITLPNLLFVLSNGYHEKDKTLFDSSFQSWKYAIRGRSMDSSQELRVIVAFENEMAILTIVRLNKNRRAR